MDFSAKITEYKESNSSKSPVWIWFDNEKEYGKCQICKMREKIVNYATTNLILHLKRHHGFLKKYNAYREFEKLTDLKEELVQNSKRSRRLTIQKNLFRNSQTAQSILVPSADR